ncbi:MAG: hypothetical protein WBG44_04905 [Comamonas sp.]
MLSGKVATTPVLQQTMNSSNPEIRNLGAAMVGTTLKRLRRGSGNGM